ncbi:hypothetical protein MY5147_008972, partial [Beauveria neobassiana]
MDLNSVRSILSHILLVSFGTAEKIVAQTWDLEGLGLPMRLAV